MNPIQNPSRVPGSAQASRTPRAAVASDIATKWLAVEKLSDGIRKFYADARKLEKFALSKVR